MAYRNEARGIGGWLLVFLIFYCVLAPLMMLTGLSVEFFGPGATHAARTPLLVTFRYVSLAQVAFDLMVQFFVGYRLCRVFTPASVRITIAALWLLGPLTDGAGIVVSEMLTGWDMALWSSALVWTGLEILFFAGGWTAYFLLSARVANTYYYLDEDNGLQATFA